MSSLFKRSLTNLSANNEARFLSLSGQNKTVKRKLIMFMIDLYKEAVVRAHLSECNNRLTQKPRSA